VQLLNLLYLEGWFWHLARGIVAQSTVKALPEGIREATFLSTQTSAREADHFCDKLQVHNRVMGYVLLVDSAGRVRWRAHGLPGEGEAAALCAAARMLERVGGAGAAGAGSGSSSAGALRGRAAPAFRMS
jgi:hypothetical protein